MDEESSPCNSKHCMSNGYPWLEEGGMTEVEKSEPSDATLTS